ALHLFSIVAPEVAHSQLTPDHAGALSWPLAASVSRASEVCIRSTKGERIQARNFRETSFLRSTPAAGAREAVQKLPLFPFASETQRPNPAKKASSVAVRSSSEKQRGNRSKATHGPGTAPKENHS